MPIPRGRRFRLRPTERARPRTGGYTLVEVVVALLISAIMVTSVFSVAITSKTSSGKSDRQLIAGQVTRLVTSTLKNYVTGCDCDPATGTCAISATTHPCTIAGPIGPSTACQSSNAACTASWSFNNGTVADSMGNKYALTYGAHTISGLLPAWFSGAPYNATVVYTVTANSVGAQSVPSVSVNVNWTEP